MTPIHLATDGMQANAHGSPRNRRKQRPHGQQRESTTARHEARGTDYREQASNAPRCPHKPKRSTRGQHAANPLTPRHEGDAPRSTQRRGVGCNHRLYAKPGQLCRRRTRPCHSQQPTQPKVPTHKGQDKGFLKPIAAKNRNKSRMARGTKKRTTLNRTRVHPTASQKQALTRQTTTTEVTHNSKVQTAGEH